MARTDDAVLQLALAQFNQGIKLQEAERRLQKAVGKAERAKQQAADTLKKLQGDSGASAEDKAAADEAYRAAVDEWNRIRSGEPKPEESPKAEEDTPAEPETEEPPTPDPEATAD